jgi:hypothetical protein
MNSEQVIIEVTAAETNNVRLNGPLQHDKFAVRWVQIVGSAFPADTVYFLSMTTNESVDIGVSTSSRLAAVAPSRCIVIPLTAATSTYTFDNQMVVLDRSTHGMTRNKSSNAPTLRVSVQSNVTNPPTFTRVTICLESL